MSLFKQIELFVSILLISILIIILNINFRDTQEFAKNQLYANAKNSANTLSLSLSAVTQDVALMQTTINAMFDGGYFEEISLIKQDGTELYHRKEKLNIEGIPTIFINFINLESPAAAATISSGWSIFGTLKIVGHPGHLYIKLWDNFKEMCLWFIGLTILALIISHLILKLLLRPLFLIKKQADAIGQNEFIINEKIPRTTETRQVVIAMNSMVKKVQNIYDREVEALNRYQELKYKDSLTRLYNRQYFIQQLNGYIASDNEQAAGEVMIIFLSSLEKVGIAVGHQKIKLLYEKLASIITSASDGSPNNIAAFLNKNELALILPAHDITASMDIAQIISQKMEDVIALDPEFSNDVSVSIGIASYSYSNTLKSVLSKVDYALSVAQSLSEHNINHYKETGQQSIMGKQEWKDLIEKTLEEHRFLLTSQPVLFNEGELHWEIFICMKDEQDVIQKAGYFMPMVTSLNLAARLDKYVFEHAINFLKINKGIIIALNITNEFLNDRSSFIWFRQLLMSIKPYNKRLMFEVPDSTVIQHIDICRDFAGLIKGMGFTFGVDNFVISNESLAYLQKLNPQYIKVNQDYLLSSNNEEETNTALKSLQTITDSLDIQLIVARIDNEEQLAALKAKNIKYFQGRAVADIVPLDKTNE